MTDDPTFDTTALRANRDGYRVHRDYAAHFFRWSWAVRRRGMGLAGRRVLDLGCGVDLPLATVATYRSQQPDLYVGVDLNPLKTHPAGITKTRCVLYGETDVTDPATWQALYDAHGRFDLVCSFEVIEHMPPDRGWALLWGMRQLVKDDGEVLLSTPVYDGRRKASNHVHEYTVDELRSTVEAAGFDVVARYGTFMDVRDVHAGIYDWAIGRGLTGFADGFDALWEQLLEFHSPDVLACFVAPVLPDVARNNLWVLRLR